MLWAVCKTMPIQSIPENNEYLSFLMNIDDMCIGTGM